MNELVLILDFGSKYRESIARTIREFNVYAEILPGEASAERIRALSPIGIIPLGNVGSVSDIQELGFPVFEEFCKNYSQDEYFHAVHKEEREGKLHNFLFNICGATGSYKLEDYIRTQIEQIKQTVGSEKVLLALSGGVDSSVCAALLSKAIPGQLTCVFVDHGLMRLGEGDAVEEIFAGFDLDFIRVNAVDRFLDKLRGATDPESKRKIIGTEFIRVFEEEAKKLGRVPFLAQGTIYPDIIESGTAQNAKIKSHHNVGGLPENLDFEKLVEPLAGLFKNEVRKIGILLGLPPSLVDRQPFPGPGLAVRVIGEVTAEKLEILRHADSIVRKELDMLTPRPDQYFAVLTDTYSVGMKNGMRTYDPVLAIRAVTSQDFMTASYSPIPHEVLGRMAACITSEIEGVSRVVYDISSKPPGTVEWQ